MFHQINEYSILFHSSSSRVGSIRRGSQKSVGSTIGGLGKPEGVGSTRGGLGQPEMG